MTGTLINAASVLVGTALGTLLGGRFPERVRETVMHVLGLFTILLGIDAGLRPSGHRCRRRYPGWPSS
jgi:uncharacterized membrane protein YqgA involved in biofilm formation